jgi:ABC-type transport system involved in multi-copper enzyme maturation permease subunit
MQKITDWFKWFVAGIPPTTPEWSTVFIVGGVLLALLYVYTYTTQAGIIARATTKEAVRQPVFILLMLLSMVLLVVFTILPFFTLGEDVKMLKDCGLATILFAGALLAVWTSSTSIAGEIEGKTAMTLLSKPVTRRQFIIGKYIGIVHSVIWLLLPIILVAFLPLIYYKVGYDARESSAEAPEHAIKMIAVLQVLPGIFLIFLEICVLAAISVAISTRLPMVVNVISCFAIYVIGHLTPVLVQAGVLRLEFVSFMARLIATIFPSLEVFNTQAAVATGSVVPPPYLGYATVYCLAYCAIAILLAFILFEDRDLA